MKNKNPLRSNVKLILLIINLIINRMVAKYIFMIDDLVIDLREVIYITTAFSNNIVIGFKHCESLEYAPLEKEHCIYKDLVSAFVEYHNDEHYRI